MKTKLVAGAELDLLTADELDELLRRYVSGFLRPPKTERPARSIMLDGSGNSGTDNTIYQVPIGYTFRLHRAEFTLDGSTFGSPYTSNSGYLNIMQNGVARDGISFKSPGLPAVWSAGTADAIEFQSGERVQIVVVGGPTSVGLIVQLQGTLQPLTTE